MFSWLEGGWTLYYFLHDCMRFLFWIDFKQSKLFPRVISFGKLTLKVKVTVMLGTLYSNF